MGKWTKQEVDLLIEHYPTRGGRYCASLLDRTYGAISERAKILGLTKKIPKWSEHETDTLRKYYPDHGVEYCSGLLGKPHQSVIKRAFRLKIKTKVSRCWRSVEDDTLIAYYAKYGKKYCCNLLNRSPDAVRGRASQLGLSSSITRGGSPQKQIIRKLCDNKVLTTCSQHGETPHYFRKGKIDHCIKCSSIKDAAYKKRDRQSPVGLYKSRLRIRLNSAFRRLSKSNGTSRYAGCFRHMPYSPQQLFDHLEAIRKRQNNECSICRQSYDFIKLTVDHIIPLKIAETKTEVLSLFRLSNLSLLCRSCNSSKGAKLCPCDFVV